MKKDNLVDHIPVPYKISEWENPRSTNPEHQIARFDPFIDTGIVALDTCTARSRKVNCFVLEI